MSINYEQLQSYMNGLVPERPLELQKMEAYADEHNFPIIGPASGHFCYQIARLTGARCTAAAPEPPVFEGEIRTPRGPKRFEVLEVH